MESPKTITTSYLVGNLHCPSCVAVIKNALQDEYASRLLWVSPNVVTSVVTVEHQDAGPAFIHDMGRTLEEAGFEICAVDTTASVPETLDGSADEFERERTNQIGRRRRSGALELWWRLWRGPTPEAAALHDGKAATHLDNCDACKTTAAAVTHENGLSLEQSLRRNNFSDSSLQKRLNGHANEASAQLEQVVVDGGDGAATPHLWRATLSIGGMTCASCSNTITESIQKFPWVAGVVVNLVANSATVDIKDQGRAQELIEAIEDLGYDAALDKVVDLDELKRIPADQRQVDIKVDGIFCSKCPDRILMTLKNLSTSHIEILKAPSRDQPFLRIRYTPRAPRFTIRQVLKAIEATDPSLEASIFHPPTLEERSKAIRAKHQREMFWRMMLTLVLAVPTFVLGIVYMSLVDESDATKQHLMEPWRSGLSRMQIILFALSTPVYFFAADIFHVRAIKEIRTMWRPGSRTPLIERFYKFGSMNMLMSLGTTIAYFSSVAQMIAAGLGHEEKVPDERFYFDSVVFLTLFLLAGRLIEAFSKSKTGDAVGALAKLRPNTALLTEKDALGGQVTTTTTPIDQLEMGDIIRVPHGASPATDGVILTGETTFDESSLTGESRPIRKAPGDGVYAGTVNQGNAITIQITGTSGKSMLDQIVEVVREGQTRRAPVEQIADILTAYFVPVITLIAVLTWIVWLCLALSRVVSKKELSEYGGAPGFAFQFAIAVFVVACPCGLALAAPTAIFVGGGIAANHGILAKGGGEAFEKASKINCVVFDKTGTLTEGGEPKITDSELFPDQDIQNLSRQTLLAGLKAVEEQSSHPIGKAIVNFCGKEVASAELRDVQELPGRGIQASYVDESFDVAVGNELLMRDLSVILSRDVVMRLQSWKSEAKSVAVVAVKPRDKDNNGPWALAAMLSISDPIRQEAAAVVKALRGRGTQVWMLSGDNVTTAKAVARLVGIKESNVLAEVLPSEKADKVKYLQATLHADEDTMRQRRMGGRRRAMVAMVGDGINDSPALTTADVGIAIGSGSDVAISSADFVLASSSLGAVLTLLDLSRTVFRRIKVNFGWAVIYNLLAVPIAAGCLYAVKTSEGNHVRLDPVWAALAMALSSISVVLSSLCLRLRIPWPYETERRSQ
ncbi:ATPase, P-type, heavy metal translocating [Moelleriella libera RCEF 2490]|uniref:ATPase, P-type, heavy metal translocating n=1 Tax=Moelleriella libera RCEF 2490 TaxID=1081109 RepID=A0A168DA30_9HYPO|nr:ATPase, P-type, heavy metal translocating [Moelleriella libera RCEF 2490]